MVLVSWIVLLVINSYRGSIKRQFFVAIISDVLVNFLLVLENFVWTFWCEENLLISFFKTHHFIIVITPNFFEFVSKLWLFLSNIFLKHSKYCIFIIANICLNIHIIDKRIWCRNECLMVHRRHWHNIFIEKCYQLLVR